MAKHRNFLSEKSDVLLFPVENLPKTSVPGVRYFRPVCRLLPSEALPRAFQKHQKQLMNVNFEALKILHTHCAWLIPKPQSVGDHRHLDKKTPHPVRSRMGSGRGGESIVSDGRCAVRCSASTCLRWPTRASSSPCVARRDGPKGGRVR